jgi:alginate O-acetyltransferase complex protein AlgI
MERCQTIAPRTIEFAPPVITTGGTIVAALFVVVTSPIVLVGWASMLVNCIALFLTMKQLVWFASPQANKSANLSERTAFYLLWPGMDLAAFQSRRPQELRIAAPSEWAAAAAKILLSAIVIGLLLPSTDHGFSTWVGIAGMLAGVLLVHCGLFHLLALIWQAAGSNVRPIMHAPLAATSLADFWGRRWNLAFRDAAALILFRPAAQRWGVAAATLLTYLASGLLHDALISLPARGGYGMPTLYFMLQYVGVICERLVFRDKTRKWNRVANRATTAITVILPLPLLFHKPFSENVILPILDAIRCN